MRNHDSRTLGASLDEQRTVADKVLGDIGELLEVVGHYGGISRDREGGYYKREGEKSYRKFLRDRREVQVNKELNVKEGRKTMIWTDTGKSQSWPDGGRSFYSAGTPGGHQLHQRLRDRSSLSLSHSNFLPSLSTSFHH